MENTISLCAYSTKLYDIASLYITFTLYKCIDCIYISKETNDLKCPSGLLGVDYYTI